MDVSQKSPPDFLPLVGGGGSNPPLVGGGPGMLWYVFCGGPGPIAGSDADIADPGPTDVIFNLAQAGVCI